MIRKPTPEEDYQLKQHFGRTVHAYFLEMIEAINTLEERLEQKFSIGPGTMGEISPGPVEQLRYFVEENHAGETPQSPDQDPGLPGPEPGK